MKDYWFAMEILGPSLLDVINQGSCSRGMTIKSICMLGIELVNSNPC